MPVHPRKPQRKRTKRVRTGEEMAKRTLAAATGVLVYLAVKGLEGQGRAMKLAMGAASGARSLAEA